MFSRYFTKNLVTASRAPTTIDITATFIFHSFFSQFPSYVQALILFAFFHFYSGSQPREQSLQFGKFFFFLLIMMVVWSRLGDLLVSQHLGGVCASHSPRADAGLCIYHLFVWSNLNFLHTSSWITFPTEPCLVLYSSCAILLQLLIMWLFI